MASQFALPASPKRSYTDVALEDLAAKRRKEREEEAYRENYKAQGGQILTEGKPQGGLSWLVNKGLEAIGYSPQAAYDRGETAEKAADILTPYGTMKQVHEGDLAGAAENLVGGGGAGHAIQSMFLPFGAKNVHLPALGHRLAESLEKSGSDPREVFKQTGYFRDRDGNWTYEMGDQGMKVRTDTPEAQSMSDISSAMKVEPPGLPMVNEGKKVPGPHPLLRMRPEYQHHPDQLDIFHDTRIGQDALFAAEADTRSRSSPLRSVPAASEIFKHDNLWEAAPDLADVRMAKTGYDAKGGWGGHYNPSGGNIGEARGPAGGVAKRDSMESVALHELQHAAQYRYGMPSGWNPAREGSAEIGQEAMRRSQQEYDRLTKTYTDRVEELKQQGMFSDEAHDQAEREMPGIFEARIHAGESAKGGTIRYGKRGEDFHGYMANEGETMARLAQTRAELDPKYVGDTHPFENLDIPPSIMFRPGGAWGYEPEQAFHGPASGTFGIPDEYDWLWRK